MAKINEDLKTMQTARDSMKTALENKGQTVTKDIRTYAEAIDNITSGSGDIQLFKTIEEMQEKGTKNEGDKAVVYRSEISPLTISTHFSKITFPETVVLEEALEDYVDLRFRTVDDSSWFDCWGNLYSNQLFISCYGEEGSYRIQYDSEDGITYNRTRFQDPNGDVDGNELDFGIELYCEYEERWSDVIGKFMLFEENTFEGLFQYSVTKDNFAVDLFHLDKSLSKIYIPENIFELVSDRIYDDYVFKDRDANEFVIIPDIIENNYIVKGKAYFGVEVSPIIVDKKMYISMSKYTSYPNDEIAYQIIEFDKNNTTSTLVTFGELINNTKIGTDLHGGSGHTYYSVIQGDPEINSYAFSNYGRIVYGSNQTRPLYYCEIPNLGYSSLDGLKSVEYTKYQKWLYLPVKTQLSLSAVDELLPGKVAYGKNGIIKGDDSIYNNLDYAKILQYNLNIPSENISPVASRYLNNNDLFTNLEFPKNGLYYAKKDSTSSFIVGSTKNYVNSMLTKYKNEIISLFDLQDSIISGKSYKINNNYIIELLDTTSGTAYTLKGGFGIINNDATQLIWRPDMNYHYLLLSIYNNKIYYIKSGVHIYQHYRTNNPGTLEIHCLNLDNLTDTILANSSKLLNTASKYQVTNCMCDFTLSDTALKNNHYIVICHYPWLSTTNAAIKTTVIDIRKDKVYTAIDKTFNSNFSYPARLTTIFEDKVIVGYLSSSKYNAWEVDTVNETITQGLNNASSFANYYVMGNSETLNYNVYSDDNYNYYNIYGSYSSDVQIYNKQHQRQTDMKRAIEDPDNIVTGSTGISFHKFIENNKVLFSSNVVSDEGYDTYICLANVVFKNNNITFVITNKVRVPSSFYIYINDVSYSPLESLTDIDFDSYPDRIIFKTQTNSLECYRCVLSDHDDYDFVILSALRPNPSYISKHSTGLLL